MTVDDPGVILGSRRILGVVLEFGTASPTLGLGDPLPSSATSTGTRFPPGVKTNGTMDDDVLAAVVVLVAEAEEDEKEAFCW